MYVKMWIDFKRDLQVNLWVMGVTINLENVMINVENVV